MWRSMLWHFERHKDDCVGGQCYGQCWRSISHRKQHAIDLTCDPKYSYAHMFWWVSSKVGRNMMCMGKVQTMPSLNTRPWQWCCSNNQDRVLEYGIHNIIIALLTTSQKWRWDSRWLNIPWLPAEQKIACLVARRCQRGQWRHMMEWASEVSK